MESTKRAALDECVRPLDDDDRRAVRRYWEQVIREEWVPPAGSVRGRGRVMAGYSTVPRPAPRTQVRLWDGRWWPCAGRYAGAPVFRYGWAPSGLATVRQLAAKGLRPSGQDVAGWLVWGPANRPRWAYLYRLDLAAPKRAMTPARWAAIEQANAAQRICPTCLQDDGYRIPRSLGCWPCAALRQADADPTEHDRTEHDRTEHAPAGVPAASRTSETRSAA